jgi:endoglucanase
MLRGRTPFLAVAATLLVVGAFLVCVARAATPPADRQTALRRAELLRRGINLSGWFAQAPSDAAHLQSAITTDDVQRIRRMGFDHVRLPVDPLVLAADGRAGSIDSDALYYLDDAVDLVLSAGLAVVVDLHPNEAYKQQILSDVRTADQTAELWTVIAHRLAVHEPDRLYFELLNEPGTTDAEAWATLQRRLAGAVRQAAPRHTIVATGHAWSAVEHLDALQPLDDGNVIYAFHLYEPFPFTHQGATWSNDAVGALRDVPYPSDPSGVALLLPKLVDPAARALLATYGQERWDATVLNRLVDRAAAWRQRYGAPVICNELGVYRAVSPAQARVAWLRDVRTSLERRGIGWTAWDYAGGFGIVDGPPGARVIHAPTARALFDQ